MSDSARKIDDGPFCWQSKAAIWRIRDAFDESTFLDQALAVYCVLSELSSDEQSATFTASRRKIAERSGVSVRRVSEILARFKTLGLLEWNQNFLVGTKEMAPNTYTLTRCTRSTTLGTGSTRLGTDEKTENCTVIEQSPKESPKESTLTRGSAPVLGYGKIEGWKLIKDRDQLQKQIRQEQDKSKPDQDIIAALRSELTKINNELRLRGQSAKPASQAGPIPTLEKISEKSKDVGVPLEQRAALLKQALQISGLKRS